MLNSRLTFVLALSAVLCLGLLPACRSGCCDSDYVRPVAEGSPSGSASDEIADEIADEAVGGALAGSVCDDEAAPAEKPAAKKPRRRRKINAQSVWLRRCAKCHGMTGGGGKGPRLVGRGALKKFATREELAAYVVQNMPPNGPSTDEDVALALANFAFQVNKRR